LSGSGLGLADDVLAAEAERYGLGLDRERLDDALRRQGVDHVLVDTECCECQVIVPCLGRTKAPIFTQGATPPAIRGSSRVYRHLSESRASRARSMRAAPRVRRRHGEPRWRGR